MSEEHVTQVFGPPWVRDELAFYKERYWQAEKIVLRLRELLRERDPSLPDIHDGDAWMEIEQR